MCEAIREDIDPSSLADIARNWVESRTGRARIRKIVKKSEKMAEKLEAATKIDPKILSEAVY
jgi:hypothetical protein